MRDCKVLLMQKDSIAKCCLAFFKSKLGHQTLLKKINKKKNQVKNSINQENTSNNNLSTYQTWTCK